MQASKIMPGTTYALKARNNTFVRFLVTAVVTRRERATGSPHDYDYKSAVEGFKNEPGEDRCTITVDPDAILGPYQDVAELRERKRLEDEARAKADQAIKDETMRALILLYKATGVPMPEKLDHYSAPFHTNYGGTEITITRDAVALLIDVLAARLVSAK